MNNCKLSNVTQIYLKRFYEILDEMIHGMTEAELTNSISHNFIAQMLPHHMAAIEMSKNILKYTTCIPLQNIAEGIIKDQTKSIENMKSALCECSELTNPECNLRRYTAETDRIMKAMFERMRNAPELNDVNSSFIREMIPHHIGAIEMSLSALKYDICPELVPILDKIISSQKRGVDQMRRLLRFT